MSETELSDELKFQQSKAFLMQMEADGSCAYDHMQALLAEILDSNPNDVSHHPERIAALSSQLKKFKFTNGDASKTANAAPVTHHTQLAAAEANKKLFDKAQSEVVTVVEKPTPYTTVTTTTTKPQSAPQFKSVVGENTMWKHCGAALPDQEAFLLDQSITRLASQRKLEEVRFVGKILGIQKNYIVISTKRFVPENDKVYEEVYNMPKPPRKKVEVDVQPEPGYKGCNRLSFWVTPDANSEWTLLPDVTPQQINAARSIRKFFTGDLNAKINAHPAFVGTEAVYLRAQLSRILSATYITPSGVLDKVEEEEEEEAEEEEEGKPKGPKPGKYFALTKLNKEFEGESTAALVDPEQWVHSENYIYETGRQTKVPEKPEGEEEEEPEEDPEEEEEGEEKKEEEERELFLPIKKDSSYAIIHLPKEPNPEDEEEEVEEEAPADGEEEKEAESEKEEDEDEIADDDPLRKKIPAWTTRQTNTVYKNHAVVVVRSLRWPGAVAYASNKGKNFGAVYIGWGFKKTDIAFTPQAATEIVKEADDIVETADPTAGNEKLVMRGEDPKEADSEDEKDEEDEEDVDA